MDQIHRKWVRDYNTQRHWAHEQREDGCHSPAQVISWHKGTMVPEETLNRILFATRYTRHLDRHGFIRFQDWRLYGERKEQRMIKKPQTEKNALWKQRYRVKELRRPQIARRMPSRGLVVSSASGTAQLYARQRSSDNSHTGKRAPFRAIFLPMEAMCSTSTTRAEAREVTTYVFPGRVEQNRISPRICPPIPLSTAAL